MYVSKIESNVKRTGVYALGERTIVVGRNAAGKSAIVAALELALTGRASEVGAQPSELMGFVPGGEGELRVTAAVASPGGFERKIEFAVRGSTARASKPTWTIDGTPVDRPVGAILTHEVADVLRSEPKRQRAAILRLVAPVDAVVKASATVPTAYKSTWDEIVESVRRSGEAESEADVLVAVADRLRSMKRTATRDAKRAPEGSRPDAPGPDSIGRLRAAAAEARSIEEKIRRRTAAAGRLDALRAEAEAAAQRSTDAGLPALGRIAEAERRLDALDALAVKLAEPSDGPECCLACGAGRIEWNLGGAAELRAEARARVVDLRARSVAAVAGAGRSIEAIRAEAQEVAAIVASIGEVEAGPPSVEYETALRDAEARVAAAETWDREHAAAVAEASRADALAGLVKVADRAVAEILDTAVSGFEAEITAALPVGRWAVVQLFDGARQVCRIGLAADDNGSVFRPWRALSGAERAGLVAALACAWASAASAVVRAVVVDDVWLDAASLAAVCSALGRAVGSDGGPTQAIVCAVEAPPIDGWTRIDLADPSGGAA